MTRAGLRRWINRTALVLSTLAAVLGVAMLAWILWDVIAKGASALSLSFFTEPTPPPGEEEGGMGNAILGTLEMTAAAALLAAPFGILVGVYLAEFGREERFGEFVRRMLDVLVSAPSIVVGVFVYLALVRPLGHFSGWGGAVALAIIMLPVIARTTEEMLRLAGPEMREAALALGAPYWRMLFSVVLRATRAGVITGVMLALARAAGETAPLLFTALNSPYWPEGLSEPTANLTVTIFNFAMSPYEGWHRLAWGGAFVITAGVLAVTVLVRILFRQGGRG